MQRASTTKAVVARTLCICIGTLFFVFAGLDLAHASRVALVIGNGGYDPTNIPRLDNPVNDARLMADALDTAGFDVSLVTDANRDEMSQAIADFGKRLKGAGRNTVGLFYYSGHGVESKGVNYLIPLGASIESALEFQTHAVPAPYVLSWMEHAGNRLNMVILDACRNNPFGSEKGGERGLMRMDAPSGSLIAFSAGPGKVAFDGDGENSPYTGALAEALVKPGLKVEDVFKRVRVRVMEETGDNQIPWEHSSLLGDFYFVPGDVEPPPTASVVLRTVPKNARILIAGRQYQQNMSLDPGVYEVVVQAQGYESLERMLDVKGDPTEYRIALCRLESKTEHICEDVKKTVYRTKYETDTLEIDDSHEYQFSNYEKAEFEKLFYRFPYDEAVSRLNWAYCDGEARNSPVWQLQRKLKSKCEDEDGRLRTRSYDIDCECNEWGCAAEGTVDCDVNVEMEVPETVWQEVCRDEPRVDRICPDQVVTQLR